MSPSDQWRQIPETQESIRWIWPYLAGFICNLFNLPRWDRHICQIYQSSSSCLLKLLTTSLRNDPKSTVTWSFYWRSEARKNIWSKKLMKTLNEPIIFHDILLQITRSLTSHKCKLLIFLLSLDGCIWAAQRLQCKYSWEVAHWVTSCNIIVSAKQKFSFSPLRTYPGMCKHLHFRFSLMQ